MYSCSLYDFSSYNSFMIPIEKLHYFVNGSDHEILYIFQSQFKHTFTLVSVMHVLSLN